MIVQILVPEYNGQGLSLIWENNSTITVRVDPDNKITAIGGNRDGLVSLARHLLTLAQEGVPIGYHIHFDESNSLEEGSNELIIARIIE